MTLNRFIAACAVVSVLSFGYCNFKAGLDFGREEARAELRGD